MPNARDFAPTLTGMHVLCSGNPVDGFTFYGPFKTGADAIAYGERRGDRLGDDSWCIAPLAAPDLADPREEHAMGCPAPQGFPCACRRD